MLDQVDVELQYLGESEPGLFPLFLVDGNHHTGFNVPPKGCSGDAVDFAEFVLVDQDIVEFVRIEAHGFFNHAANIFRIEVVQHRSFRNRLIRYHNIPATAALEIM